jgi:hypothetical protein
MSGERWVIGEGGMTVEQISGPDLPDDGTKVEVIPLASTEPSERIQAAIERCRRIEEERGPEAAGLPVTPAVMQARGEVQVATYLRELLEQPLTDEEER